MAFLSYQVQSLLGFSLITVQATLMEVRTFLIAKESVDTIANPKVNFLPHSTLYMKNVRRAGKKQFN